MDEKISARFRRDPAERARHNPRSRSLAIAAFCFQCKEGCMTWGKPVPPDLVKLAVRDCKMVQCPLWPHRGWQNLKDRSNRGGRHQKRPRS